jgi:hypothetical protein
VYWTKGHDGASCGGANPNAAGAGFLLCQTQFGTAASPNDQRQFHVVGASSQQLLIQPRKGPNEKFAELTKCCFPSDFTYVVRASHEWVVRGSISGPQNDLETVKLTPYPSNTIFGWTPPDNTQCRISQNPLNSMLRSRALEVSCAGNGCAPTAAGPAIAPAAPRTASSLGDLGCVYSPTAPLVPVLRDPSKPPTDSDNWCIYQGLKSNFVIYKGSTPSVKDYEYDWTVFGGFTSLSVNLSSTTDTNTSPLAMVYSSGRGALLVADGSTKGIVMVDLATLGLTIIY